MRMKACLGISVVLLVAACGGTSSLGTEGTGVTQGDAGDTGGNAGMGGTGMGGDPNIGGMGGATAACMSDGECVVPAGPCEICADGSYACPSAACVNGQCETSWPTCGAVTPQCMSDADCGAIGAPCEMCPDGTWGCPKTWCDQGTCAAVFPTCGTTTYDPCYGKQCGDSCDLCDPMDPNCAQTGLLLTCDAYGKCGSGTPECTPLPGGQCMTAMDCPQSLAPCEICADGSAACPTTDCINGQCVTSFVTCPDPMPSACMTDSDCPQLYIACQMCPDGSAACPQSFCDPTLGQCVTLFPSCTTPTMYDPCANKMCGDQCTLCDPNVPDCVETADIKACDTDGICKTANFACPL